MFIYTSGAQFPCMCTENWGLALYPQGPSAGALEMSSSDLCCKLRLLPNGWPTFPACLHYCFEHGGTVGATLTYPSASQPDVATQPAWGGHMCALLLHWGSLVTLKKTGLGCNFFLSWYNQLHCSWWKWGGPGRATS